jgi:hypothetical protein
LAERVVRLLKKEEAMKEEPSKKNEPSRLKKETTKDMVA